MLHYLVSFRKILHSIFSIFVVVFYIVGFLVSRAAQFIFKKGKKVIIVTSIILSILTIVTIITSLRQVKSFNKTKFITNTHYIYDRSGALMGYTAPKISIFTPLAEFPPLLKHTILAIEDRGFYSNMGISINGILRSIIFYLPSRVTGYRPRGGSTITQQLMRQLYLSNSLSFTRKFREIILSIVATTKLSKDDILEVYMNNAYFCNNIYGFKSAADVFFGKKLEELDANEIAILVSMLKGPEFSPMNNLDKLIARKNIILKVMHSDKLITTEQYGRALSQSIEFSIERFNHVNFISLEVKNHIIKQFGQEAYDNGGLKVYTSIDANMQKVAQDSLQDVCLQLEHDCEWEGPVGKTSKIHDINVVNSFLECCGAFYTPVIITNSEGRFVGHKVNGTLNSKDMEKYKKFKNVEPGDIVIIDKKNHWLINRPSYNGQVTILKNSGYGVGDVLASVGGIDLFLLRDDITKIPREVGSCMKIIDSAIIFHHLKLPTNTKCGDWHAVVKKNKCFYISESEFRGYKWKYDARTDASVWPISDWDSKLWGDITLRVAFENSRNIPFVALILNQVTAPIFKTYLDQLQVTKSSTPFYPSYILGSVGISPRQFAETMCGLINYGNRLNSIFIKETCDENNNILYKNEKNKPTRVISEQSVYGVVSCMKGCVVRGTGQRLSGVMSNIGTKTGTSSNNQEAMCMCVTKEVVIFITICKNNGKSLGNNVWGAAFPVLCCRQIIEKIKYNLSDGPIMPEPQGIKSVLGQYNLFQSSYVDNKIEAKEILFEN